MNPRHTREGWAEYMRNYRKNNPQKMKAIDLKKRFGISLEAFEQMMEKQNSVCKICGLAERSVDHRTKQIRHLAVDHCHTTGRIRGLLCSDCNTAIGLLKESPEILRKASEYLSFSTE